jgi:hypothetical protein
MTPCHTHLLGMHALQILIQLSPAALRSFR